MIYLSCISEPSCCNLDRQCASLEQNQQRQVILYIPFINRSISRFYTVLQQTDNPHTINISAHYHAKSRKSLAKLIMFGYFFIPRSQTL